MRIIFILRSVVLSGGIERVMTDKANWLASHGHNILFLTYEQGSHFLSFPLDPNVLHEDLDCPYYTVYKKNILVRPFFMMMFKFKFGCRLKSIIKSFHPDKMVVPSNLAEFLGPAVSMNKLVPIVFECHSTNIEIFGSKRTRIQRLKNHIVLSYIKRCSLVVSLTDGDAQYWRNKCKKVAVVPNPLSYYPDSIDTDSKVSGTIICVARLQRVKRIDRLIEAFSLISAKYPDWHIDIFGDGEEKGMLLQMIAEKKLQNRIKICAPTPEIYKKYVNSEFIVISSDSEGFSLVLIEAMSCGLPVVAVDCPYGPSAIVQDGVTGVLSKMSASDLADKIEWMITHKAERNMMGIKAYQVAAKYKKDVVMKKWEEAYENIWF